MKTDLKRLFAELSYDEQRGILQLLFQWHSLEGQLGFQRGLYSLPAKDIQYLKSMPDEEMARFDCMSGEKDRMRSLKAGITDFLRGLPRGQREKTGPQINAFLRHNLPDGVFRRVYSAVGLDPDSLAYDSEFARPFRLTETE